MGTVDELKPELDKLRAACDAQGRDFSEIEVTCMWRPGAGRDVVAALEEVGVSRMVGMIPALGSDPVAGLTRIAEEFIGA